METDGPIAFPRSLRFDVLAMEIIVISIHPIRMTSVVVLVIMLATVEGLASNIVYDNTTTPVKSSTSDGYAPDGFWPFDSYSTTELMGNRITLAGTDRIIREFDLILSSSQPTVLSQLTLSFYKPDGLDVRHASGAPGTQLWTDTLDDVAVNGVTTIAFDVPEVLVPDTFIWVTNADSMNAGMATYCPPTIGTTSGYFWDHSPGIGWYAMNFEGDPAASFGARVVANPEPTTLAILVLGGLAMIRRKRA